MDKVILKALDDIAVQWNVPRHEVVEKLLDTYGGTLELAIIEWYYNHTI